MKTIIQLTPRIYKLIMLIFALGSFSAGFWLLSRERVSDLKAVAGTGMIVTGILVALILLLLSRPNNFLTPKIRFGRQGILIKRNMFFAKNYIPWDEVKAIHLNEFELQIMASEEQKNFQIQIPRDLYVWDDLYRVLSLTANGRKVPLKVEKAG
ncbi:hypothetical protein KI659_10940 [Litoribacter alkaliphilus]|uniref:Uncharacterized protein n=1 Tax=Litoribacter ruber TaxID=702568 RepID=A0AAP2CJU6_9BACT|nr:hypothetical protein [Litoribacter alkaliphilus]MBS9524531.1 hypothetical protein [Litoribacter alkaliphilus]